MHSFEIKEHNGVLTLLIDGKPDSGLMFMPTGALRRPQITGAEGLPHVTDFAAAGVHIYNAGPVPIYREDNGDFDYDQMDAAAQAVLTSDPEAWMLPRVFIPTPPGWLEQHREEKLRYHDGTTFYDGPWARKEEGSWTSEPWREVASRELAKFVKYVESKDYGSRVLGYHICHGVSGEWVHTSAYSAHLGDYSPANQAAFRKWLREKYGCVDALRDSWSDPAADFDRASIPTLEQRKGDGNFVFRNPKAHMQVVDFYLFHAHTVADTLNFFCRTVKEACDYRKLIAVFYGYLMGMTWHDDAPLEGGHFGFKEVLDAPYVDFISSPCDYAYRAARSGVSAIPSVTGSVARSGKLWLDENDVRTHITPQVGFGWTDNLHDTIVTQQRQLSLVFSKGLASWWMDQNGGWYADDAIMSEIARLTRIGGKMLDVDRSSEAQIAYVIDDLSMAYTESKEALSWAFLQKNHLELMRVGAPVDEILLSDLPKATNHKLYIFANAWAPDDERRKMIDNIVKRDGKTALWLYAPGYIRDGAYSAANICEMTGMNVRQAAGHYTLVARTIPGTIGCLGETEYGSDHRFCPLFWVEDPSAQVLAKSEDMGRAVLARKNMGDWTSIYSVCGPLTADILREFARDAGVHIWWEGDGAFYANRSFFACHARREGRYTVNLPRSADVYDLLAEKTIATSVTSVELTLGEGETGMYLMGG